MTLFTQQTISTGEEVLTAGTTADFNGDGKPDLVAVNRFSGDIFVLLGDGSGGFGDPTLFPAGAEPVSVTTADFNGDGKTDVMVGNQGSINVFSVFSVLLGNGSGGLGAPIPIAFSAEGYLRTLETADFNGDGKTDLILVVVNSFTYKNNITLMLGDGSGGFGAPISFAAGNSLISATHADFNGDGKIDLAVTSYGNQDQLSVMLGDGSGGFSALAPFNVGYNPTAVTPADFNGDGKIDLALANNGYSRVQVLLGNGSGGFDVSASFRVDEYFGDQSLVAADFNNDGKLDLAASSIGFISPTVSSWISVALGDGSGGFDAPIPFAVENIRPAYGISIPPALSVADFNGDGKPDLVAMANSDGDNTITVLLNTAGKPIVTPAVFTLMENSVEGTLAGTVTASNATQLSYAITAGNSSADGDGNPAFAINAATGAITVNDAGDLDFETIPSFNLTVTATTPQGFSGNGLVSMKLVNADEPGNEAPFAEDAVFTATENSANGAVIGTVIATDVDAGDSLTFAIISGNSDPNGNGKAAFAIDPATGILSVNDSGDLDVRATPQFKLQVMATDAGGLSANTGVTVTLANINDAPMGADHEVILGGYRDVGVVAESTFKMSDFGFSDSSDSPPNSLSAVKIDTLPEGIIHLTNHGIAVNAGQFIPVADITGGFFKYLAEAPQVPTSGIRPNFANFTFQVQDDGGIANGGIDLDPTANTISITLTDGGSSWGDPHLVTFDGLCYDFQATGDFVLVRALDSDLDVQVRQAPWRANPGTTVNAGLATVIDGNQVIFDVDHSQPFVNGASFALALGESRSLGQGTLSRSIIAGAQGEFYTLDYANGDQLLVHCSADYIDPTVYLVGSRKVEGLLGNNNGQAVDDLALPYCIIPAAPPGPETLYGDFANSWRVTPDASLFTLGRLSDNSSLNGNNGSGLLADNGTGSSAVTGSDAPKVDGPGIALPAPQLPWLETDSLINFAQPELAGASGGNAPDASGFAQGAAMLKIIALDETGVTNAAPDVIGNIDFNPGDKIDLSAIDADTAVAGDQAFTSLREGAAFPDVFTNPGALYFDQSAHILYGNNDTDGAADFFIQLASASSVSMDAFVW